MYIFKFAVYPGRLGTYKSIASTCSLWRDIATLLMIRPEHVPHLHQGIWEVLGLSNIASQSIVCARDIIEASGQLSSLTYNVQSIIVGKVESGSAGTGTRFLWIRRASCHLHIDSGLG
jgi:hypothetical protein